MVVDVGLGEDNDDEAYPESILDEVSDSEPELESEDVRGATQ